MNVLKPSLQTTIKTLLDKEISQREIHRKTRIDRKTIRRYARSYDSDGAQEGGDSKSPTSLDVATGSDNCPFQNPQPRPPASAPKMPKHVLSACESHREWIEEQVRLGRNAWPYIGSGGTVRFHSPIQQREAVRATAQTEGPEQ
jgi:hypothetical protein